MAKAVKIILFTGVIVVLVMGGLTFANVVAVSLDWDSIAGGGVPAAGSNHGWQFTVNELITVTHLGLYDDGYNWDDGVWGNGFRIEHPIGLWRLSDSALLASGTISAGTVNPLLDRFRYIDIPDIALSLGEDYVIGFFSASDLGDGDILKADDLQVDPAIDIVVRRWDGGGGFQMPANIYEWDPHGGEPYFPDMFGPNFQFIPEPATILLLALGGLALLRKRRA